MKKIKAVTALLLSMLCVLAFAGCNDEEQGSTEPATEHIEVTEAQSENNDVFSLRNLHSYDIANGDELAGAWSITDGEGSKLGSFVYLIDGKGRATLIVGTTGYCSDYKLEADKKTFTCQLMFGINGSYTYEKTSDNEVILTNTSSNKTSTITRVASFDIIPIPPKEIKVDDTLIGAWKSDSGEYYYFDEDGIMYQNQFGSMFTYYTYSAEGGLITAVSNMGKDEDTTDMLEYSTTADGIKIDGYEYKKIPYDELI